jgi:hypothetical protein
MNSPGQAVASAAADRATVLTAVRVATVPIHRTREAAMPAVREAIDMEDYLQCTTCGIQVAVKLPFGMVLTGDVPCLLCKGHLTLSTQFTYSNKAPASKSLSVTEILEEAAETFRQRNQVYGNAFERFGDTMMSLFPAGIHIATREEWNRIGVYFHLVGKVVRYAANFEAGGHQDSAHDAIAYSAMLEYLTKDTK